MSLYDIFGEDPVKESTSKEGDSKTSKGILIVCFYLK